MPSHDNKRLAIELAIQHHAAAYYEAADGTVDRQTEWIGM